MVERGTICSNSGRNLEAVQLELLELDPVIAVVEGASIVLVARLGHEYVVLQLEETLSHEWRGKAIDTR